MKKTLKRGLSFFLALIMVVGLLPVTAFAAVDSSGKPTDLNNTLVLSIYTPEGSFPGEPAMHGSEDYVSFSSKFKETSASGKFKDSAVGELKTAVLNDLVQGASSGSNTVWGVFSADGLKEKYFESGASIIQPKNEAEIIRVIKGNSFKNKSDAEILKDYEIIWYVIKLQHSPASNWWGRATTEWHIDGVIREKKEELITINYYGNGNTEGSAPDGVTNHVAGEAYTVQAGNNMKKKINGVYVDFLGWSARADGTGTELAFYKAGDVIYPEENISLYAMWDTTTQHTATVNTYLDNVLIDADKIHEENRVLYLSTDTQHYYKLTRVSEGVYTTKITGNGKFLVYSDTGNGYNLISNHQLTIYNQDASLDIHHYSVTYDPNGGTFETEIHNHAHAYGQAVTAIEEVPTKEGYRFIGWEDAEGNLIQPEAEVTASITAPITLTAQWEKNVNVTINVTVNHVANENAVDGYDQTAEKDDVVLSLVSKADSSAPYLEVGDPIELNGKVIPEEFEWSAKDNVTTYTGTLTDMPGGTAEYNVVVSKHLYEVDSVNAKQDADGNWTIDVKLIYQPTNFDLAFSVEVDQDVPAEYVPVAAIVRATFWASDRSDWEIITQHKGSIPGVRVNIDPNTRKGSGSYPVWMDEEENAPYGYRMRISAFVYPDGTIVSVSDDTVNSNLAWSDDVYTATMIPEAEIGGKQYGKLYGVYYDHAAKDAQGKLHAVITMDLHDVTFDAMGGTVNDQASQTVKDQYKVPAFNGYVPVRDGGYTFGGWYKDEKYEFPAVEGEDLDTDITLYAKWIEPLTISGTVSISGTYQQNGETVSVHGIDKATEAVVVLQELRNGTAVEIDSETVTFGNYENSGSADYSFVGIPNDGKQYQIHVLELNYVTTYDNESDTDNNFTANEYAVVFGEDNVADVDAHLAFAPSSYDQVMKVDATQIAEGFRPANVLAKIIYRDVGDNHPYQVISQHDVAPYGVRIPLSAGIGSGSQSVWKWHTDGTLYAYQMDVTEVDGESFNSDTAPYYITYTEAAYWNEKTGGASRELQATLIPKQYLVAFDVNAGTDTVTGMESCSAQEIEMDGQSKMLYVYPDGHKWSFNTTVANEGEPATAIVPVREGYRFLGWETSVQGVSVGENGVITVSASVHENVILTAQWEQITYDVTLTADPEEGGAVTGADTYAYGTEVTVTATANPGYTFMGWYEDGKLVSKETSFTTEPLTANRNFVAKFDQNHYSVVAKANPENGGTVTVSGNGTYTYGENVTVTATENTGYTFTGWYRGDEKVSDELTFDVVVTENLSYTAKFEATKYTVVTTASPAEGGAVTGTGSYTYGTEVIAYASAKTGYNFVGWYENETLVSEDAKFTFTVEGDRTLTAKFVETHTVKVTVTSGGTATGDGTYNDGETATVVATADKGYKFMGWYEDGNFVDSSAEYSFVVKKDHTLKAEFAKASHTVTVTADPAEGGTVTGGGTYAANETATITAVANSDYVFIGWYEDGKLVKEDASFSWTVREDRTLTATFVEKTNYRYDFVYLFGYNDTKIGATGPLLRGELAQMIYRLVKQNFPETSNGGNVFSDTSGQWFQSGISYMASKGAIDKNKSNAYPYVSVTRGETYKMICLGLGYTDDSSLRLSQYAAILRNHGFDTPDGSVNQKIVRHEFCALFNAILGRTDYELFDKADNPVTHETYGYTDLDPNASYYRTMLIATSSFENRKVDIAGRMERNKYDYNG